LGGWVNQNARSRAAAGGTCFFLERGSLASRPPPRLRHVSGGEVWGGQAQGQQHRGRIWAGEDERLRWGRGSHSGRRRRWPQAHGDGLLLPPRCYAAADKGGEVWVGWGGAKARGSGFAERERLGRGGRGGRMQSATLYILPSFCQSGKKVGVATRRVHRATRHKEQQTGGAHAGPRVSRRAQGVGAHAGGLGGARAAVVRAFVRDVDQARPRFFALAPRAPGLAASLCVLSV
jgi:hypothetical protein